MSKDIDFAGLVALAQELLARPGRQVIAIVGAPGAGKSTLVERLAESLADTAILPMDGFHYDDAVLHQMGRRPWKGAPDTFDVGGLRSTLARLRDPAEGPVAVPVFDRDLEISRGSARIIGPEARLILAEGNYLLLNAAPWRRLAGLWDLSIMLDVPMAELRRRLTARWQGLGCSPAEVTAHLENDLGNADLVLRASLPADLVVRAGG